MSLGFSNTTPTIVLVRKTMNDFFSIIYGTRLDSDEKLILKIIL